MGQVDIIQGNVFASSAKVVSHGCNIRGRFASGFAAEVARRYPEAKRAYLNKYASGPKGAGGWALGEIQGVLCGDGRIVVNVATQENYGRNGNVYADLEAIAEGLEKVARMCKAEGYAGFAMPRIGAGLGGLPWPEVQAIVEVIAREYDVEIEVYHL